MSQLAAAALVALSIGAQRAALGAEADEVEGSGESTVIGDNVVSARRRALAAASEDAVARAAAGLVGAEVALREPSKLRPIRKRATRYLRTYRVLEETQQGARFRLRLAAKLDERRLRQDLLGLGLALAKPAALPTLRLILSGGEPSQLGLELTTTLRAALAREGFASEPGGSGACPPSASCLEAALRTTRGEEVRGIALAALQVELSLSLRTAGASPISRKNDGWGWGSPQAAARSALERALPAALAPILAELRRRHPPAPRAIRITGLTGLAQLEGIESALRERVPGVSSRLRELARGEARFEVKSALDAPALGAALEKLAPSGFSLTISGIEGGTLWLTLRSVPGTAR